MFTNTEGSNNKNTKRDFLEDAHESRAKLNGYQAFEPQILAGFHELKASTRTFTASGLNNLPVIAVYTDNNAVSGLIPGIATSEDAVQALAQRFAMQTVIDVLEIEGRRALLPDFVISTILRQLQVNTTYEPLLCPMFKKPDTPPDPATENCITVGSTETEICPKDDNAAKFQEIAKAIDGKHLTLSGTIKTMNIIMADWWRLTWQNVVDRALRSLRFLRSGLVELHLYTVTVTVSLN
ncbi:hypothetical protein KIN20_030052 [Parelaphostrongylus tenuis]|uniref:Uncharacterized protein n=1 Tax=Parelaphostrongylus tenuis TaxID=148309 RepID=A0AAD5R3D2_PARTN|nr:hypothetical protein KIN20_030052 [Parelaphostrongylus tenuis]